MQEHSNEQREGNQDMTYSIQVRAPTRVECKRRVSVALTAQCSGQPAHVHDRPHVERALQAWIDLITEKPTHDIVCDVYGYIGLDAGAPHAIGVNAKVYSALRLGATVLTENVEQLEERREG